MKITYDFIDSGKDLDGEGVVLELRHVGGISQRRELVVDDDGREGLARQSRE